MPRQRPADCASKTLLCLTIRAWVSMSSFVGGRALLNGSVSGFFARQKFLTGQISHFGWRGRRTSRWHSPYTARCLATRACGLSRVENGRHVDPRRFQRLRANCATARNIRALATRGGCHFRKPELARRNEGSGGATHYNKG